MKILFLICLLMPGFAFAGFEHGNGGDAYAAEFVKTAEVLSPMLVRVLVRPLPHFNPYKLTDTIMQTKVNSSSEPLILDGEEVDAINYPAQKQILISRARWTDLQGDSHLRERLVLVLHEYLGIMREDDSGYVISNNLIRRLNMNDPDLQPLKQ